MFGNDIPITSKNNLQQILGISKEGSMRSYLGILESLGGSKTKIFNYIKERSRPGKWVVDKVSL